jgi:protein DA1
MRLSSLFSYFRKKSSSSAKNRPAECCLCDKALSGKVVHDAWNNAAHLGHKISFCSSCDRLLSPHGSGGAYQYSDGRLICGFCKKTAVTDGVSANRSRRKVLALLEKTGFCGIPKNIEIVLAHPKTLSAHSRKRNTSGLTLSHYHFSDYKRVAITHQIGVLHGLPRVEFEAVMAHELLHVWQHENSIKFSPLYREGLCELGGFLVYSEDGSELGRYFIQKMTKSQDPVYGNGFRLMHKKLEKFGWRGLIREILENKHGFEASILEKILPRRMR